MRTMVLGCALVALLAASAEARVWTDTSGSIRVEAELVNVKDGRVYLRKPDGKIATVELQKLSPQDQEFIKSGGVEQAAAPQPAGSAPATGEGMSPERFDEAIRNNPNDPGAYYSRGLARMIFWCAFAPRSPAARTSRPTGAGIRCINPRLFSVMNTPAMSLRWAQM